MGTVLLCTAAVLSASVWSVATAAPDVGSPVDAIIDRLSAPELVERENASGELGRFLAGLAEQERKGVLRRLAGISRSHPDPAVCEKLQEALAPYKAGVVLWEAQTAGGTPAGSLPVLPEGIVSWCTDLQGKSSVWMVKASNGGKIWEKKQGDLPGKVSVVRSTPDGLCLSGLTASNGTWSALYDPKTGKEVKGAKVPKPKGQLDQVWVDDIDGDQIVFVPGGRTPDQNLFTGPVKRVSPQGKIRWECDLPGVPNQLCCRSGRVLYSGMTRNNGTLVICLDADTGKKAWSLEIDFGSSFEVAGDRVFARHGGLLLCLDLKTGRQLWSIGPGTLPLQFQFEPASKGIWVVGGIPKNVLRLYDLECGKMKSDFSDGLKSAVAGASFLPQGLLVYGSDANGAGWLALIDKESGKPIWERQPGEIPGKPLWFMKQENEIWLMGDSDKGNWFGAYSLVDGKSRAQIHAKTEGPISSFWIGERELIVVVLDVRGALGSILNVFDLKSGRKVWDRRLDFNPSQVQPLPTGLLVSGFGTLSPPPGEAGLFTQILRLRDVWDDDGVPAGKD